MSTKKPNVKAVKETLDAAQPVAPPVDEAAKAHAANGHFGKPADGKRPPPTIDDETGLPEDCPVLALGTKDNISFYLDEHRQLRALKAKEHTRLEIQHMFGTRAIDVHWYWPRIGSNGNVTGWKPDAAAEQLMAAAARQGVWDPMDRVRGAGAWRGGDGELILNYGDAVWIGPTREETNQAIAAAAALPVDRRNAYLAQQFAGRWIAPGAYGRFVYPATQPIARHGVDVDAIGRRYNAKRPGDEVLKLLRTWSWKRKEIDALLLLGWVAAAILGGALKWRVMCWITGGPGTGKSTLQEFISLLFGDGGMFDSADTTAAGIWQELRHRTVPVKLDELEADADNSRQSSVIKLARLASSGGKMNRGGADHGGVSFTIRSCFLFSSILIPPLMTQDRSRLAILELTPLAHNAELPEMPAEPTRALGRALRQRLVDQWHRLDETVEIYRDALQREGFDARGRDQFGTLLALADLALYDHDTDTDSAEQLAMKLGAAQLADIAMRDAAELAVLGPLLGYQTQGGRAGELVSIAECIERLLAAITPPQRKLIVGEEADIDAAGKVAEAILKRHGVRIIDHQGKRYVAIANQHPALTRIYAGTVWNTPAGASESVWKQALMRVSGAIPSPKAVWFTVTSRAVYVPVDKVIGQAADDQNTSTVAGEAGGASTS